MTEETHKPNLGGRPTLFKEDYVRQVELLCRRGATLEEIAEFFGVSSRTILRWKLENDQFCRALKIGAEVFDDRVEMSLYHRATGYKKTVKKISPDGEVIETVEDIPPDTTAMIFWLKNRKPAQWRVKAEDEKDQPQVQPIINVNLPPSDREH